MVGEVTGKWGPWMGRHGILVLLGMRSGLIGLPEIFILEVLVQHHLIHVFLAQVQILEEVDHRMVCIVDKILRDMDKTLRSHNLLPVFQKVLPIQKQKQVVHLVLPISRPVLQQQKVHISKKRGLMVLEVLQGVEKIMVGFQVPDITLGLIILGLDLKVEDLVPLEESFGQTIEWA